MALSKNTIKYLRSLQLKKFRQKYNNFVLEGDKIVRELLQQTAIEAEGIYALPEWVEAHRSLLSDFISLLQEITLDELAKISSLSTPNQVLAVARQPIAVFDPDQAARERALYLDGIQDPGNMGAILRIADWFGIRRVYCAPDCADVFGAKVVQASMGAVLRVSVLEMRLEQLREQLPGLPILGAVLDGANVFEMELPPLGLLVIGNESRGISPTLLPLLTHRLTIPRGPGSGTESLNAAVAAGILAAWWQKGSDR